MGYGFAKRLFMVLLLLCIAAEGAHAQWQIVAKNSVAPINPALNGGEGVITFKDGILWAGTSNLAFSSDTGKTWTMTNLPATSQLSAISFWNSDIGLISNGGVGGATYWTTDRGNTWSTSQPGFLEVFCSSQTTAYGLSLGFPGSFCESTDGGQTWNVLSQLSGSDFTFQRNGTIVALKLDLQIGGGRADFSVDTGYTWTAGNGTFILDSYSVSLDSCDASTLYIASENYLERIPDSISQIFRSSDNGATWQATMTGPIGYISGSLSSSTHALYAATISNGILRSTDHGMTWENIGGPGNAFDSRCICAINDNVIFVLDSAGNVWATFNSGGDSVTATNVTFGAYPTLVTQAVNTDTLGATVRVPITIQGLTRPEDVNLVLHYDGSVDYLGSFSRTGMRLDIPGDSSYGHSKLHIAGAVPDSIAGYAEFNVFSDSGENAHATFDSLDILTAVSPCAYSPAPAVTSTIFPPKGCDIPILSQLIHLGREPLLSVRPNPATGHVWITASGDLGVATIAVYDMLGTVQSESQYTLRNSVPVELALPQDGGVYTILVKSGAGTFPLRVVCER